MKPTARTIAPGYRGPRVCHRCGRSVKDYQTLVSLNPLLGEWNPDLCGKCLEEAYQVYRNERVLHTIRLETAFWRKTLMGHALP